MQKSSLVRKALLTEAFSLVLPSPVLASDLYEDYHGGFGSGLFQGFTVKPDRYGPQPQRSLNSLIRQGLGDYDHDGMMDRFDFDADNDGMINRFDRDPYDSRGWSEKVFSTSVSTRTRLVLGRDKTYPRPENYGFPLGRSQGSPLHWTREVANRYRHNSFPKGENP